MSTRRTESVSIWIIEWFKEHSELPPDDPAELRGLNYLEAELIDSFGVVELVASVEEHFSITFSPNDFQDRRFTTIGGLAELVAEHNQVQSRATA